MVALSNDKRTFSRHIPLKGTVAITPAGVCQLIDVSSGGMLLEDQGNLKIPKEFSLDILSSDGKFYEKEVPVKLVWEKKVPNKYFPFFILKRVGVRFWDIPGQQRSRLDKYIEKQTTTSEKDPD